MASSNQSLFLFFLASQMLVVEWIRRFTFSALFVKCYNVTFMSLDDIVLYVF